MSWRHSAEQIRQDDYLYRSYLKEYNRLRGPLDFSKFYYKFNRRCMIVCGAYVCNMDLMSRLDEGCPTSQAGSETASRSQRVMSSIFRRLVPPRRSLWRRQLKMGWLSWAILAAYLVLNAAAILNIAYLYEHDISRWRLRRVQELMSVHGPARRIAFDERIAFNRRSTTLGDFEQVLLKRVNESRRSLRYIRGDKYAHWASVNEMTYLAHMASVTIVYLFGQFANLWLSRSDVQMHRDHIDYPGEQERVDALCSAEVLKFLESNRVHMADACVRNQRVTCACLRAVPAGGRLTTPLSRRSDQSSKASRSDDGPIILACSRRDHLRAGMLLDREREDGCASDDQSCRMLMEMLEAGALRPMNRSNLWMERRDKAQFVLTCSMLAYAGPFDIFWTFVAPSIASAHSGFDIGETWFVAGTAVLTFSIIYHVITLVVSFREQLALVARVRGLIHECIDLNRRHLLLYCSDSLRRNQNIWTAAEASIASRENEFRQMAATKGSDAVNSNLLFALMTYKIFVAQLAPFKQTFKNFFIATFSISFSFAVLGRTHVAYGEQENYQLVSGHQLRLFALALCTALMVPVDYILLPFCVLHCHCQRLYKALSSLLAHITEVRGYVAAYRRIYNEHAVSVLIKELAEPQQMLRQFEVESLGYNGTFASLLELHFWWGLIVLSILINTRDSDRDDFFWTYLRDPLNVWNFYLI